MIAHNKTLAAQLCNEFREFFPENAVEYFVSYYDYYQPEAYVPAQDLYIEKDSSINDEIDRLRHAATAALLARRDVIIVASVSCIYGIGSPSSTASRCSCSRSASGSIASDAVPQAGRHAVPAQRHRARRVARSASRGRSLEIFPAYAETAYRIALFGDEIESIQHFDPLTGEVLDEIDHVVGLARDPLRDQGGDARARGRRDQAGAERARAHGSRTRARSSRRTGSASAPSTTSRC